MMHQSGLLSGWPMVCCVRIFVKVFIVVGLLNTVLPSRSTGRFTGAMVIILGKQVQEGCI